jgi:CrcB protein
MVRVLIVFGAGGAGCVARYFVNGLIGARAFPFATLTVNIIGSFLIGLVFETSIRVASFPEHLRLALTTGFMGGLTTYSSFNYETTRLAQEGQTGRALLNVGITLVACAIAGLLGLLLARRLT